MSLAEPSKSAADPPRRARGPGRAARGPLGGSWEKGTESGHSAAQARGRAQVATESSQVVAGLPGVTPRRVQPRLCGRAGVSGPRRATAALAPAPGPDPSPARSGGGQQPAAAPHHQLMPAQRQPCRTRHVPARRAATHVRRLAPLPASAEK